MKRYAHGISFTTSVRIFAQSICREKKETKKKKTVSKLKCIYTEPKNWNSFRGSMRVTPFQRNNWYGIRQDKCSLLLWRINFVLSAVQQNTFRNDTRFNIKTFYHKNWHHLFLKRWHEKEIVFNLRWSIQVQLVRFKVFTKPAYANLYFVETQFQKFIKSAPFQFRFVAMTAA